MFSTRLWALWVLFQALPLTNPPMVVGTDSSHSQRASRASRATPRQHFHSTFFLESCIFSIYQLIRYWHHSQSNVSRCRGCLSCSWPPLGCQRSQKAPPPPRPRGLQALLSCTKALVTAVPKTLRGLHK